MRSGRRRRCGSTASSSSRTSRVAVDDRASPAEHRSRSIADDISDMPGDEHPQRAVER